MRPEGSLIIFINLTLNYEKATRQKIPSRLKAYVALEAFKNQQTLTELAKKFEVNPVMISKWKAEFSQNLSATFEKSEDTDSQELYSKEFYATIGQLKVENEILKKVVISWASRF